MTYFFFHIWVTTFLGVIEEGTEFGLYCGIHNGFDNLIMLRIALLFFEVSSMPPMKECPPLPTWLVISFLERYEALLWPAGTISLAWYVTLVSGCVAV